MTCNFLLEIGTEEIPAGYLEPASRALKESFVKLLTDGGLALREEPTVTWTPRRIVLFAPKVPARQEDRTLEVQGPPARIAFDPQGKPTKAAIGFARTNSVPVETLSVRETPNGSYVIAVREIAGRPTLEILAGALPELIASLPFPKSMHWDVPAGDATEPSTPFARPIRSLLCLFDHDIIPFHTSGVTSSRAAFGHPFLSPGPIEIPKADYTDYCDRLRKAHVIVDAVERKALIRESIEKLLAKYGSGHYSDDLLEEVTNLVEYPCVVEGSFDKKFLSLPREVIITAMTEHQRYFAVEDQNGNLAAQFLSVSNRTPMQSDEVRRGNERVLAARLNDAVFFWKEDTKTSLSVKVAKLDHVTFQEKLGTYGQRTERIRKLANYIARATKQNDEVINNVDRAALLSKADLVTHMVYEFPVLQGIMGTLYAEHDGEKEDVAVAISEHYLPRSSSSRSRIPESTTGSIVALADKIDTIAGCFAVGLIPTGSQDPYGLRRAAQGIIRIIINTKFSLRLGNLIGEALALLVSDQSAHPKVMDFIKERLYQFALEGGAPHDLIRAALGTRLIDIDLDIIDFHKRLESLIAISATPDWNRLVEAVERTHNITREFHVEPDVEVNAELLEAPEEKNLYELYMSVRKEIDRLEKAQDYLALGKLYEQTFAVPLNTFFEKVFVNVKEENVRNNRLTLLKRINDLYADRVADLSQVSRKE